jgi:hypothetical protein
MNELIEYSTLEAAKVPVMIRTSNLPTLFEELAAFFFSGVSGTNGERSY